MTDVHTPGSDSRVEGRGVRVLPRPELPKRPPEMPRTPAWLAWVGVAAALLVMVFGAITLFEDDRTAEPRSSPIEGAPVGIAHLGLQDWIAQLQPETAQPHLGLQDWIDLLSAGTTGR